MAFESRESWPSRDLCLPGHEPNLIPVALHYLTLPSEDISHRNAHIQFRSLHKYLWSSVPCQACTEQIRGARQPGPGALAEFLLHRREDPRAQAGREVSACPRRTQRDQEAWRASWRNPGLSDGRSRECIPHSPSALTLCQDSKLDLSAHLTLKTTSSQVYRQQATISRTTG